jgi:imidazole glycerol-phosphate synthase subunit HisF
MLKKRIIPCLDIHNGRTVKGVNFVALKDAGDPIALAKAYAEQGADELVFLDISASIEQRDLLVDLVKAIAAQIDIPFTVGGGIKSVTDAKRLIQAGADKVSINSAAVLRPTLIQELAQEFGSQAVVVAIDSNNIHNEDWVCISGGRTITEMKSLDWAIEAQALGAGEILLTSMEKDGTKSGFDVRITEALSAALNIPLIASGGAGSMEDFKTVFEQTQASAALAASIFHFGEISIPDLKNYLKQENISIR